jgi:prepilin-type processing-associated H-X9-DG protein
MRQLALASCLYRDDFDHALPWSERFWTAPSNQGFNYVNPASPSFHPNFHAQLRTYVGAEDGFWYCPTAREDKSLTVPEDRSPLLGYMGNMYAVGVVVAEWPEAQPKRESQLLTPSSAKLFIDNGANWQGVSIAVTVRSVFSATPITPTGLHDGGVNAARADGSALHVNRAEFNRPGGPAVPLDEDPRQNWWRDGAVELAP